MLGLSFFITEYAKEKNEIVCNHIDGCALVSCMQGCSQEVYAFGTGLAVEHFRD